MDLNEWNQEVLECSRYGEDEDLKTILLAGGDPNYADEGGNTGLHKAAANGNTECIKILLDHGAIHKANESGNFPIHWAAQNGQLEVLKILFERCPDCDVLAQNIFGRSTLTEAFDSKNMDVIEICISHPSSSEDRLLLNMKPSTKENGNSLTDSSSNSNNKEKNDNDNNNNDNDNDNDENSSKSNAIFHEFCFDLKISKIVKIRELPIIRADNPFGSETSPEDDTTGLGIWPASLLASKWIASDSQVIDLIKEKCFLELGAGCGLPSLTAAIYCLPRTVYISDINPQSLDNATYNVKLNTCSESKSGSNNNNSDNIEQTNNNSNSDNISDPTISEEILFHSNKSDNDDNNKQISTIVRVLKLNWMDKSTYPIEKIDVILGSDLVYERRILTPLTYAVSSLLQSDGTFLYVAPDENRDGMDDLIKALLVVDIILVRQIPCPIEYYENPLIGENNEDRYVLHFYDLPAKKSFSLYEFKKQNN